MPQHEEGRERWRERLDRLREECSCERTSSRDEVSRLSERSEEAEKVARQAAGAAEEELNWLKVSLSAEFTQVSERRFLVSFYFFFLCVLCLVLFFCTILYCCFSYFS